ncbi:hypothetical protein Q5692_34380 [Microcoleus sp. C2C3]|uniref:hypothetical protein n=1 Tax=unclassified Microcoleus TaxID=2642155 RepID=UPI002FD22ADE
MKNTATYKLEAIFCRETAMLCPYLKTAVTVNSQQSTVNSQQSTVNSQQSTVNSQQSTIK